MLQILLCILGAVVIFVVGFCMGCSWIFKRCFKFTKEQCRRGDKFVRMFRLLNYWMQLKESGKSITCYMKKMGYNNIAIYGIGYLGKHLIKELYKSEIHIDYLVDKKVVEIEEEIVIYKPEASLPETDVMIITAIMDFDDIADKVESKIQCPIISLEDVIYAVN